jgi:hypothetical protein
VLKVTYKDFKTETPYDKLLLSYGRRIIVLFPENLVNDMRNHASCMSEHYAGTT